MSGTVRIRSAVVGSAARPPLPHVLRRGRSWFGTMVGRTADLPRGRPLRIGFGWIERELTYPTEISTTHQFRLPRRF